MSTQPVRSVLRAFSLIEMMVVLVVLAIVLSIVLPALGHARNAARKAATLATMVQLSEASEKFERDNRRWPGYFTPKEMGSAENEMVNGFSGMENILIDLAGGKTDNTTGTLQVGPTAQTIYVDVNLIGSTTQTKGVVNAGYFKPDAKYFYKQDVLGQKAATVRASHLALPDLVDSFGQPILAWTQDDVPAAATSFGEMNSQTNRAKFYWAQNTVFTRATILGKNAENQDTTSLLGAVFNPSTLEGMLGHPAFPDSINPNIPASARGPMVFHSAGANGVYVGNYTTSERGGKIAHGRTPPDIVQYSANQDPMEAFDDILVKAGN